MTDAKEKDPAHRLRAAELYLASIQAETAYDDYVSAIDQQELPEDAMQRINDIEHKCLEQVHALRKACNDEVAAIREAAQPGTGAEEERLKAAWTAARDAYDQFDCAEVELDGDGNPILCALTFVPIFEDDEVLRDNETGEVFLRSAVGVQPRAIVEEAEGEEMEDA